MGRDLASSAQSKCVDTAVDGGSMRGMECITATVGTMADGDSAAGDKGSVYQMDDAETAH